jgi:hypothetical protein
MPIRPNRIIATASLRQISRTARPRLITEIASNAEPAQSKRMVTSQSMLTPRC